MGTVAIIPINILVGLMILKFRNLCCGLIVLVMVSRLALKIVVMALGKRQEARGKSEEGLGDFTFLYILLFEKPLRVYGFFRSPT